MRHISIKDDIICKNNKKWVPESVQTSIIQYHHTHCFANHQGSQRTTQDLSRKFWWPNFERDIQLYIQSCLTCQTTKRGQNIKKYKLQTFATNKPWEIVQCDIVGPFTTSAFNNTYILTMMDRFSNFTKCVPIPNKEATTVAMHIFNDWICTFGCMQKLLTDRGGEFLNELLKQLCSVLQIHKLYTAAYTPSTNGKLERFHKFLKDQLNAIYTDRGANWEEILPWDTLLPSICATYNSTPSATTNLSPHQIIFGDNFTFPGDTTITIETPVNPDESQTQYYETIKQALQKIQTQAKSNQELYDKKRLERENQTRQSHTFKPGDKVMLDITIQGRSRNMQTHHKWEGPYIIITANKNNNSIEIRHTTDFEKTQRVNANKLKYYKEPQLLSIQESRKKIINTDTWFNEFYALYDLLYIPSFARNKSHLSLSTPNILASQISNLANKYEGSQLELMAGSGEITRFLRPGAWALEKDEDRIKQGTIEAPMAKWYQCDLRQAKELKSIIQSWYHSFDVIVSNPSYDMALQMLKLGSLLLKNNKNSKIIFILPTTFFTSSRTRQSQYKHIPLQIVHEKRMGKWNYLWKHGGLHTKITDDSIFIFEPRQPSQTHKNTHTTTFYNPPQ